MDFSGSLIIFRYFFEFLMSFDFVGRKNMIASWKPFIQILNNYFETFKMEHCSLTLKFKTICRSVRKRVSRNS